TDTWDTIRSRFPPGWFPDFIVLKLDYTTIAQPLWSVPVALIGLAGDWNLLYHHYRRCLPRCDLVLTHTLPVEVLARHGLDHARFANLYGCEQVFLNHPPGDQHRDIDILFVGNVNAPVQRERMPWLARLAALADRWNVVIRTNVHGVDYRELLARSRV